MSCRNSLQQFQSTNKLTGCVIKMNDTMIFNVGIKIFNEFQP